MAYDVNSNQTEISETVGALTVSLRRNLWDEKNRLKAVNLKPDDATGHPVAIYTYDAGGARTLRYNYDCIDASVNGGEEGQAYKDNVMVYPSGLMMGKAIKIGKRDATPVSSLAYTKHCYIGAEHISAKTGTLENFGGYPQDILDDTGEMTALTTNVVQTPTNQTLGTAMSEVLSVANSMGAQITLPSPDPITNIIYPYHDPTKLNIYYFHPDHLGSSSYVTNASGVVSQHMEYLPFGETLVDEHLNSNNSPFKYNGKEFDEETGNYYYSSRYYDPKWVIFISVDPLVDNTRDPYGYCLQNPIKFIDPTGMSPNWVDNGNGTYTAEKGDSAWTLHKDAGISFQEAKNLLAQQGKTDLKVGDNVRVHDQKIIFVNGKVGFGSPEGGEKYWDKDFVNKAMEYTGSNKVGFVDSDYYYYTSAQDRYDQGFNSIMKNFGSELTDDLKTGDKIVFVTHSMGAAFAEGYADGIERMSKSNSHLPSFDIVAMYHFNAFQAADIKAESKRFVVDFQNTNDPVINNNYRSSPGNIQNADLRIRTTSNSGHDYIHRSPIDNANTWNLIKR